jgi:hypothetical protein
MFHKHLRSFIYPSINGVWSSFHLKTIVGYFQYEQLKKKPEIEKEKHPLFTVDEHAGTRLITLLSLDDSSRMSHPK